MTPTNGARVSPAGRTAERPIRGSAELRRELCPGMALLDELQPPRVWCSQGIRTAVIEPDVVVTAGVTASSNHLLASRVEDPDGFAFGAIAGGVGVDLELEAADLSGLLRCELELQLQSVGVTTTANDEGARKGIQAVFADAIER